MSKSLNKVMLIGNLGEDPDTRYTATGGAVCNIRVATSESWRDKQTGEQQEQTEWHRVVMFGKLGEIATEYLKKGSKVFLEGRLRTRKWTDNEGVDRYSTEIVANDMQMLGDPGRRQAGSDNGAEGEDRSSNEKGSGNRRSSGKGKQGASQKQPELETAGGGAPVDDFDDDIPF